MEILWKKYNGGLESYNLLERIMHMEEKPTCLDNMQSILEWLERN